MPTTYDLSPRDVALYQRSNEYLSRLNALDPYSREYANVYNDYVDTIDQLSNRDFRASLGSTLLEFAPMTRPRVQPRASAPVQKGLSHMYTDSLEPTSQGLTLMQQVAPNPAIEPQTQEVVPYGITVSKPDWEAYPYTTAESQSESENPVFSYINSAVGPYAAISPYSIYGAIGHNLQQEDSFKEQIKPQSKNKNPTLSYRDSIITPYGGVIFPSQVAEAYIQRNSSGEQAEPKSTASSQTINKLPPSGIEISNLSPSFGLMPPYTSPYARALASLSWLDEGI